MKLVEGGTSHSMLFEHFYISATIPSYKNVMVKRTKLRNSKKNQDDSTTDHNTTRVLLLKYILSLQR